MRRRRRLKAIHVATLDPIMAKSEAVQRALAEGARRPRVRSAERIYDPDTDRNVWEIVLAVTTPRRKHGRQGYKARIKKQSSNPNDEAG